MSGAAAGAVMASRRGPKQMVGSAVVGGVILGLLEGLGAVMNHFAAQPFRPVEPRTMPGDPACLPDQGRGRRLFG